MYAHIRGSVLWVEDDAVVISANGLGLRVRTLPAVLSSVTEGASLELYLHHIVREDSEALVGFPTRDQARLFATLLDVSGVGPKVAIALLATHGPDLLRRALVDGDESLIAKAPGVGKRLAARIIVELGDRMSRERLQQKMRLAQREMPIATCKVPFGASVSQPERRRRWLVPSLPTRHLPLRRSQIVFAPPLRSAHERRIAHRRCVTECRNHAAPRITRRVHRPS